MSVVAASEQTKRNFCIALFNRELHKNNCCPGNYVVEYGNGWFTWQYGWDEEQQAQRPDLTAEADRLMELGETVYYSSVWNTYVLIG